MPTHSKRVRDRLGALRAAARERRAHNPHHSFRRTRRRDYVRPLILPGVFFFAGLVTRTLWTQKKTFGLFVLLYALLYAVLVGVTSQEAYSSLSGTLQDAGTELMGGDFTAVTQAGLVFVSIAASGIGSPTDSAQQVFTVLLLLLAWLTIVWLLRKQLAGHAVKLRDGLYNSGAPLFATMVVAGLIVLQLLPVGLAIIGYSAATASGLLAGGVEAMLFWVAAGLLAILSLYWITSSLLALVVVTLPGMYPIKAMRTAGKLVLGRRVKILLRWLWMFVVVVVGWALVLLPIILLDMVLKAWLPALDWLPIVPVTLVLLISLTVVWCSAYVYLLYRKVVDHDD